MHFFIGTLNLIAIIFIIWSWYKRQSESSIKVFFFPALIIKLLAGLLLGLVYKFHYGSGDTFVYFGDAMVLAEIAYGSPIEFIKIIFGASAENLAFSGQPRALFFVKILSLPAIITFKNYWISGLYISLFSFFGTWELTKRCNKLVPETNTYAVVAFLFYPSFVFWSSGVLKEPVTVGCLYLCLAIYLPFLIRNEKLKVRDICLSILMLAVVLQLKFYYAVVFIPLLFVAIVNTYLKKRNPHLDDRIYLQFVLSIILIILFYFPISYFQPLLNFQNILTSIVRNHDWYLVRGAIPIDSYIHFADLKPELFSFLKNFPLALFSGLFRPTIFDANNVFQFLAGVENSLLLVISVISVFNIRIVKKSKDLYLIFILSLYILILASILAFAAPNFGTLMRYKVAFLPFFAYLVFCGNPILARFNLNHRNIKFY